MSNRSGPDGLQRRTRPVAGMTCDACEKRVGRALSAIAGVDSVEVSARRGTAVVGGARLPSAASMEAAIRCAGYEPGSPHWLTADASTWFTVALSAIAIVAAALLVGGAGLADLAGALANPSSGGLLPVLTLGATAGVSTCLAVVGGLALGLSAAHAAAAQASGAKPPPFAARMRPQMAFNVA